MQYSKKPSLHAETPFTTVTPMFVNTTKKCRDQSNIVMPEEKKKKRIYNWISLLRRRTSSPGLKAGRPM